MSDYSLIMASMKHLGKFWTYMYRINSFHRLNIITNMVCAKIFVTFVIFIGYLISYTDAYAYARIFPQNRIA